MAKKGKVSNEVIFTDIRVNIPALRQALVELMKDGFNEMPLDALLHIIKENCLVENR